MDLEESADEFMAEAGIKDFRCPDCEIEFSTDDGSSCPKCGGESAEV